MLSLGTLAALDYSIWLRSGEEASSRLQLSQPNVSRRCRAALRSLQLRLVKQEQEWEVVGPEPWLQLLQLERDVHQQARWLGQAPLRLEGTYWSGPLLASPDPEGWVGGRHDLVGNSRPLQLLLDGVIDAWIAPGPDWPDAQDERLAIDHLCSMPVHLEVAPGHPLLRQLETQGCLDWSDLQAFPSLALPSGVYPKVEEALRRVGLWNSPSSMHRYRHDRWEGRSEAELLVGYGTVLSEQVAGGLVRLPLQLPIRSGEALVVQRRWQHHPRTRALAQRLRQRLQVWAGRYPELQLLGA